MEENTVIILEVDGLTGESIERTLTVEELAQRQLDIAANEAEVNAVLAAQEAKSAARASAIAKLSALGLTEEEIASFTSSI
jgi:hypothetical protein